MTRRRNGYGEGHQPSPEGPPGHALLRRGSFSPPDLLEHPDWYTGFRRLLIEYLPDLLLAQGHPTRKLTVYRALPQAYSTFGKGDWVTPSPTYAQMHAEGEQGWHIIQAKVPAKDVRWAGDDLVEWGYWGPTVQGREVRSNPAAAGVLPSVQSYARAPKLEQGNLRKYYQFLVGAPELLDYEVPSDWQDADYARITAAYRKLRTR